MLQMLRRFVNRIRYRRFDDEIAEELRLHREMKDEELKRGQGTARLKPSPTTVDRAMGNELLMREKAREVWVPPSLDALQKDLRDALRLIARRPLFTAASVAALIAGVGAATIAFGLINALIIRPLPVERPEELVYLRDPSFSYPIVREVRARSAFLTSAFGWNLEQYEAMWSGDPDLSMVMLASGTIHTTLGIRPAIGRVLTDGDEGTSAEPVGVLSYAAWQRRFGGDPSVLGRVVRLQGLPITIVGVTPRGFFGVAPGKAPEITVPVTLAPRLRPDAADVLSQPGRAWLHVMGRLRPATSRDQADAEFQVLWPQVLEATVAGRDRDQRTRYLSRTTGLESGIAGYSSVRNQFRQPLLILAGLAGLLLLVGCATVANMLLANAWGRSRELAVRLALGCSRWRLARQLLIEGLVLATLAGVVALAVSQWAGAALVALLTTTLEPVALDLGLDWRLVAFTVGVIAVTAVIFSAAPVVMAVGVDPGPALKTGSRQMASQGGLIGRVLVSAQTAFSVVLLVGAALLVRSLGHLLMLDPGFDSRRLLTVYLDPSAIRDPDGADQPSQAAVDAFYRNALDRLRSIPGVVSASLSLYPPVSHDDGSWTQSVGIDDEPVVEGRTPTFFNVVSPGHFATVGTRLLAGRDFSASDDSGAERVVIINESLATRYFAAESPLGRRITIGRDASRQRLTIVGVVADSKYQTLQEATSSTAYLPHSQAREYVSGSPFFASVRVASLSSGVVAQLRTAIREVDARVTPRVTPLTERIQASLVTERVLAVLAVGLAACALFLACTGLFGLMMHLVARRTREIGVRLALGAQTRDVLREILGQALGIAVIGVALGVAMALASAGWIRSVLHGVMPNDPVAYLAVAVLMLALAGCAGLIPARHAAAVDPIDALRAE